MAETRPYYTSRQVIDVDTFLGERGTSYVMCVSKAQLHALRVMAKTRLLWPTTWAKERYEQSYSLPEGQDWDDVEEHISEWIAESETIEMCNAALVTALESIADNIRLASCCYEGGVGYQQIDDDFYWGTETPLDEPTTFGEGEEFATEEEWQAHKCAVANGIVNGLIGSLNGFSVLSLFSLTAAGVLAAVVGVGIIFVPPIAVIAALLFTGFALATFTALANAIDDYHDELVCILWTSHSAQEAYDNLRENLEDLSIDLGVLEVSLGPLLDLIMQMAPIDTMNKLYTNVGLPAVGGTVTDCDDCESVLCEPILVGIGTRLNETDYQSGINETNGNNYLDILFNVYDGHTFCGPEEEITVSVIANTTGQSIRYRCWHQEDYPAGTPVYDVTGTPPSGVTCGAMWANVGTGTGSFSLEVVLS